MGQYFPYEVPPGVVDRGTEYATLGRWYRANQIRWRDGILQPMGGWAALASAGLSGVPRAMHAWVTSGGAKWVAIGTDEGLFVYKGGNVWDITPAGYTAGRATATGSVGFGVGPFGAGAFGTPRTVAAGVNATTWQLDNWGEYLVAVASHEGVIYEWQLDVNTPAAAVSNAPTANAILATEERILLALGAAGNPRRMAYSDQEDNTDWTASATDTAGGRNLDTDGSLIKAVSVRGGYLALATTDAHLVEFIGRPQVFRTRRLGDHGLIAPQAVGTFEGRAAWMGDNAFWLYDGGQVRQLECDLAEYVWGDINYAVRSMFHCGTCAEFGELYFFYASAGSPDIDRYVVWCWEEGWWSMGELGRTAWIDRGVLEAPLAVSADGTIYEHEVGWLADGASRVDVVYGRSGPVEIGDGGQSLWVSRLIPDEAVQGEVEVTLRTRFTPQGAETTWGPYTLQPYAPVRAAGRQMSLEIRQKVDTGWRWGKARLEARAGGRR